MTTLSVVITVTIALSRKLRVNESNTCPYKYTFRSSFSVFCAAALEVSRIIVRKKTKNLLMLINELSFNTITLQPPIYCPFSR